MASSRTAKLWLLYMQHIRTIKMFIMPERTVNLSLHLVSVERMLKLFAAPGHNNYANCACIYLQLMQDLPIEHPWLHEQFATHGYQTVRSSDRYWRGLYTDLVTVQTMMISLKTRRGLTHASGMTESVWLTWVRSKHKCASIHDVMSTKFWKI